MGAEENQAYNILPTIVEFAGVYVRLQYFW